MIYLKKKKITNYKIKTFAFSIISLGIIFELAITLPHLENNKTKFEMTYSDKFQEKGFDGGKQLCARYEIYKTRL